MHFTNLKSVVVFGRAVISGLAQCTGEIMAFFLQGLGWALWSSTVCFLAQATTPHKNISVSTYENMFSLMIISARVFYIFWFAARIMCRLHMMCSHGRNAVAIVFVFFSPPCILQT